MNYQSDHGVSGHAEVLTKSVYSALKDVVVEEHHEDQSIDGHSDDEDHT